ncbi:MFS transporter [Synechococcus sp. ATX 2A4]|uniref:MFS transporter n=1 Tax=Synechococcus sp. ATX 2A4 TaxID=2823727 RepID=UPI0020CE9C5B|nr:MFS transporter [Synechococcus sp. ATX 2A4]MCP9886049.1 MFS transporter [Synechococcus sp. ATX 2A4]
MNNLAVILYVCLGAALGQAGLFIDLPSLPQLATAFGVDAAATQTTVTAYALGYGASQLVWGPLSDRRGRKPIALAGLGVFIAASLLLAVVPGFGPFLVLRVVQGVGAGCGTSVSRAALRDVLSNRELARAMSFASISFALALGLAPFVGGLIARATSWRVDFLLLAALGLTTATYLARALPESLSAERAAVGSNQSVAAIGRSYLRLAVDARFLLPALIATLATGMIALYDAASPFIFETRFGFNAAGFGSLSLGLTVAYISGALMVVRFVVARGQPWLLRFGLGTILLGGLLMVGLGLGGWFDTLSLFLPMLVITVGASVLVPIGLAMPMQAFPAQAGQASALTGFLQQEGSGLLVLIATVLPATSQLPLALTLLALALVLGLLVRTYTRHTRLSPA